MVVAALDGMLVLLWHALHAWWRGSDGEGRCVTCGADTDPALDECLTCLADRHW